MSFLYITAFYFTTSRFELLYLLACDKRGRNYYRK